MRWKHSKEYRQIGITAFLVVAASMLLYFLLFRTSSLGVGISKILTVLNPVIYGFIIAYILNPQETIIENAAYKLLHRFGVKSDFKWKKSVRLTCVVLSLLIFILIIYGLISTIMPELVRSVRNIIYNFQNYANNINHFIDTYLHINQELDEQTTAMISEYAIKIQEWLLSNLNPRIDSIADNLRSGVMSFVAFLKNFFLGMIISIYILVSKEVLLARFRRIIYSIFPVKTGNRILFNIRFMDEKFGGFIIGKLIDSVIIGFICYFCCGLLNMPYQVLISVFIGVTNLIPFFGPFIGAIPTTLLIFVVSPVKALIFVIFIVVLQQFDGNFLGPRILGSSVGVSSFMVILAILVGGGFLGVPGMLVGVPLAAVISAFIQGHVLHRMRDRKLPGDINSYHNLQEINPITGEVIPINYTKEDMSLYDWIRYRDEIVRSFDEPLREYSWERTMADIDREDAVIDGTYFIKKKTDEQNPAGRKPAEQKPEEQTAAAQVSTGNISAETMINEHTGSEEGTAKMHAVEQPSSEPMPGNRPAGEQISEETVPAEQQDAGTPPEKHSDEFYVTRTEEEKEWIDPKVVS